MSRLAGPIANLRDDLTAAAKIRSVVAPLAENLLRLDVPVVFDFAGNTVRDRAWVKSIGERAAADVAVHYIRADDATCRARVADRNRRRPEGLFFGEVFGSSGTGATDEFLDRASERRRRIHVHHVRRLRDHQLLRTVD
jgi:hypothetical protein